MKIKMFFLVVWGLLSSYSEAQDGSLDLSFGVNGKVTTTIAGASIDKAYAMSLQPDGKIILAGHSYGGVNDDFALIRYNSDGNLDLSFGINGKVITPISNHDYAYAMCLQPDGKILVAGYSYGGSPTDDFVLVRYNSDGSLDLTFDSDGIVTTPVWGGNEAYAVTLQSDGKILVAGKAAGAFALVRYNTDGSLDFTFDSDGIIITAIGTNDAARAISVQSDGKILVAGYAQNANGITEFALVRYNTDGSLDLTFHGDGIVTTTIVPYENRAHAVSIQPDGKILLAGSSYNGVGIQLDFALVRYNTNGNLDLTFDNDGIVITPIGSSEDVAFAMSLQLDGKILLAGYSEATSGDFALVRYNSNGSLDLSFDTDGKVTTSISNGGDFAYAMCIQPDGKILVGGHAYKSGTNFDFVLVRYNNTITPINKIENPTQTLRIYPNPFHSTTTIEFDTDLHDAELSLYNVFGQKVKTISNISDSMIQLNRAELATGFYVVCLVQDKKVVATGKIVVTD